MLVQIRFTTTGCCSAIGAFNPGDTARLSAGVAEHLVKEAKCAQYVTPKKTPEPEAAPVMAAPKTKLKLKGR